MSNKSKVQKNLADKIFEKVFKIRLKGTPQEFPLTPEFLKSLEQEYAIKYLESLKIEPTKTNIAMVLKNNPLSSCKFAAGWNASGLIADSLTIVARQKKSKVTGEKIHSYTYEDLKKPKKLSDDPPEANSTRAKPEEKPKDKTLPKISAKSSTKEIKPRFGGEEEKKEEEEPKYRFLLDYTIDNIKKKYLFPFNESKIKKHYRDLMDDPNTPYLPKSDGPENEIFTSKKYCFPFSQVTVTQNIIKDLQIPIKVNSQDILKQMNKLLESFPFSSIPYEKPEDQIEKAHNDSASLDAKRRLPYLRKSFLKEKDILKTKEVLKSEEFIRVVGIILHLSYWQIFGHVNPVQPDIMTKKQMIIACMEQMNKLRKMVKSTKIWSLFTMPMVILALRMMIEFFLRNTYNTFFETEVVGDIGMEKVNLLISNLLDQNNFYSRFSFFESEVEAINKKFTDHLHEGNLRHKRMYGTSPYLDLLFPNPQSDFVRTMLNRKNSNKALDKPPIIIEETGTEETQEAVGDPKQSRKYLQQSYQVKMFQLLLDKVDDDLPVQYKRKHPPLNFSKENL